MIQKETGERGWDQEYVFLKPRDDFVMENDELWKMLLISQMRTETGHYIERLIIGDSYESSFGGGVEVRSCLEWI